jgi:hypothetical protein
VSAQANIQTMHTLTVPTHIKLHKEIKHFNFKSLLWQLIIITLLQVMVQWLIAKLSWTGFWWQYKVLHTYYPNTRLKVQKNKASKVLVKGVAQVRIPMDQYTCIKKYNLLPKINIFNPKLPLLQWNIQEIKGMMIHPNSNSYHFSRIL